MISNTHLYQDGTNKFVTGRYMQSFHQQLVNRIDDLIYEKGLLDADEGYSLDYSDLDEEEQAELVALVVEDNDRDAYSCLHQEDKYNKDDDIVCALLKLLKNNTPDNREDLATIIYKHSINTYAKYLQDMIDDRCGWVFQEWKHSGGFDE